MQIILDIEIFFRFLSSTKIWKKEIKFEWYKSFARFFFFRRFNPARHLHYSTIITDNCGIIIINADIAVLRILVGMYITCCCCCYCIGLISCYRIRKLFRRRFVILTWWSLYRLIGISRRKFSSENISKNCSYPTYSIDCLDRVYFPQR